MNVLWIHFEKKMTLVQMYLDMGQAASIELKDWDRILPLVDDFDIVVLDGGGDPIGDLYYRIYTEKKKRLLLVACTSFQAASYKSEFQAKMVYSSRFCVNSWTLEEYKEAQACGILAYSDEELLDHHFYAGGSIRFMYFKLEKARLDIKASFDRVRDYRSVVEGLQGQGEKQAVNTILAVFNRGEFTVELSEYVMRLLSKKVDRSFIGTAKMVLPCNASWQGWVLELEFMILLRQSTGVTLMNGTRKVFWKPSPILDVVDHRDLKANLIPEQSCWIIPEQFNQGCFDAIYVHNRRKVDIFNVTLSRSTKEYKLSYVRNFLGVLADLDGKCDVTFYIVNPPKHSSDLSLHRFLDPEVVASFDSSWNYLNYWEGVPPPPTNMMTPVPVPLDKRVIVQFPPPEGLGRKRSYSNTVTGMEVEEAVP